MAQLAVLLGLLVVSDAAKLVFAERYEDAFKEAAQRNVPVVILDFDGWSSAKGDRIEFFYEDKAFLDAADGVVLVLAGQEQHQDKTQDVDGVERKVCSVFGGVSCAAHQGMLRGLFGDFAQNGELKSPLFIVATPDHKLVSRNVNETRPAAVLEGIKQAASSLGKGMRRSDFLHLRQGLHEADQALQVGDYARVNGLCEELGKIPGDFAPKKELQAFVFKLEEAGKAKRARAEQLLGGERKAEGVLELDELQGCFGKLGVAREAAARLSELDKQPEWKTPIAALKSVRAARSLYLLAFESERKGDLKSAIGSLEKLMKSFPDTKYAAFAKSQLEALRRRIPPPAPADPKSRHAPSKG